MDGTASMDCTSIGQLAGTFLGDKKSTVEKDVKSTIQNENIYSQVIFDVELFLPHLSVQLSVPT